MIVRRVAQPAKGFEREADLLEIGIGRIHELEPGKAVHLVESKNRPGTLFGTYWRGRSFGRQLQIAQISQILCVATSRSRPASGPCARSVPLLIDVQPLEHRLAEMKESQVGQLLLEVVAGGRLQADLDLIDEGPGPFLPVRWRS